MPLLLLATCFVAIGLAAGAFRFGWRLHQSARVLAEQVRDLKARLDAAEHEATRAALCAEVTQSVLVEKGVADQDELEEIRRQFRVLGTSLEYVRERDGELH